MTTRYTELLQSTLKVRKNRMISPLIEFTESLEDPLKKVWSGRQGCSNPASNRPEALSGSQARRCECVKARRIIWLTLILLKRDKWVEFKLKFYFQKHNFDPDCH